MGFKEDESFLRFLSMGAIGSSVAWPKLEEYDHLLVELDRGGGGNKLWATKLKRQRPPDLLCVRCGRRFEVRAKSKLEVRMSHTPKNEERFWDAGLRDQDACVFLLYRENPNPSAAETINAFRVSDMREHFEQAKLGPPKSAGEGSERDVTWPSWAPKKAGRVEEITERHLRVKWEGGSKYGYRLKKKRKAAQGGEANQEELVLRPLLEVGDTFPAEEKIIAALFEPAELACPGGWVPDLSEEVESFDLYCNLKALNKLDLINKNRERLVALREYEDVRVRLEAIGALAKGGEPDARQALLSWARKNEGDAAWAMEATFLLTELGSDAKPFLADLIETATHPEARSAAVWGLMRIGAAIDSVIPSFGNENDDVAMHAVVSASRLTTTPEDTRKLLSVLSAGQREAAAAYHALRLAAGLDVGGVFKFLGEVPTDSQEARFAILALASADRATVSGHPGWADQPVEVRDKLDLLWFSGESDWLSADDATHKLDILNRQRSDF